MIHSAATVKPCFMERSSGHKNPLAAADRCMAVAAGCIGRRRRRRPKEEEVVEEEEEEVRR
jgi:hypothetical protein